MLGSLLEEVVFLISYPLDPTLYMPAVEVYSPDGGCQSPLKSFPESRADFFLYLLSQQILACGGSETLCFVYMPSNNTWSPMIYIGTYCKPYGLYNGKIYFSSAAGSYDVLDPNAQDRPHTGQHLPMTQPMHAKCLGRTHSLGLGVTVMPCQGSSPPTTSRPSPGPWSGFFNLHPWCSGTQHAHWFQMSLARYFYRIQGTWSNRVIFNLKMGKNEMHSNTSLVAALITSA